MIALGDILLLTLLFGDFSALELKCSYEQSYSKNIEAIGFILKMGAYTYAALSGLITIIVVTFMLYWVGRSKKNFSDFQRSKQFKQRISSFRQNIFEITANIIVK